MWDGVAHDDFSTGAALFDQEWSFGTRQMAAPGFAQHAAASDDPARRAEALARMEARLDGDRVTAAIARRVAAEPTGLPKTYPGERYPVDTAAGAARIGRRAPRSAAPRSPTPSSSRC